MFCPNCGSQIKTKGSNVNVYEVNQEEKTVVSTENVDVLSKEAVVDENGNIGLCPYCGKPLHLHLDEEDVKKLSQNAHAKLHSANNKFNTGMCGVVIGTILIIIAAIFFLLCFRINEGWKFKYDGEPFIVFVLCISLSLISYTLGTIFLIKSKKTKHVYKNLIKDIQNGTFIQ